MKARTIITCGHINVDLSVFGLFTCDKLTIELRTRLMELNCACSSLVDQAHGLDFKHYHRFIVRMRM